MAQTQTISTKEELAMSNKKFTKLAVLSLLGVLGLTACNSSSDEVYAKPSTYDDKVVTIDNASDEIYNNILKIIYDSMHDGSAPQKVIDKVMYKYSESIYGTYDELKAAANDASATHDVIDPFIRAHKVYWLRDENGKHINNEGTEPVEVENDETFTPCEDERDNVSSKLDAIEERIAEAMYNKATGGSYTKKHFFSELDFVKALYKDGKKVNMTKAQQLADLPDTDPDALRPVIIDYKLEKKDAFTSGLLHEEFYRDEANGYTYIKDEVIDDVYNDLLVEQYLLDEDISAVRNSRGRQINVLKIEKYSSFTNNADALVKKLVEDIYAHVPATADEHVSYKVSDNELFYDNLFDTYATVSKGLYEEINANADALAIVNALHGQAYDIYESKTYDPDLDGDDDPATGTVYKYYNNTTYGDLIQDYKKFKDAGNDYNKLDMSLYNKFTGSGTTTEAEALDQATIDIDQSKTITKGWFINGSQPTLDNNGTINDRLFKISVANAKKEVPDNAGDNNANLNELEQLDRIQKGTSGWARRDTMDANENSFLCSINGAYFLKFEGQYSETDWWRDIVYDDGSAYYVVQVMEAVKDNKIRASGLYSYSKTRDVKFLNSVIEAISKKVAETGSYASLSKEYWLKKMSLTYHDQKVYDYFKNNYPDLFE